MTSKRFSVRMTSLSPQRWNWISPKKISRDIQCRARWRFACARCLEERTRRFHVIKTYCVREADLSDPDAELSFTPDGKLDVRELAYTELVLEVPTVLLCSDDCAGLCPKGFLY